MKFETLRNNNIKWFIGGVVLVSVLSTLVLSTSLAKYQTSQRIKLAEGKINYVPYDFKIMAMYQDDGSGNYQEIETMPSSGYVINEEKSYCTLDNKVHDPNARVYTDDKGQHVMSNLSKKDKCYLWFDKKKMYAKEQILINKDLKTRTNYNAVLTTESNNIIYKSNDGDGETYYFAGKALDNYVMFANFYWRIVRINGDETIRLIYQGTSAVANGQTGTSLFNSTYNNNMYVGYKYQSGVLHGTKDSSTIMGILETWYKINIVDKSFAQYVDVNAGFCGDRKTASGTGIGTTNTNYAAYYRLYANKMPKFQCDVESDLYTKTNASKGNKSLNHPVGLITADEVSFAGGVYGVGNAEYYLYTGQNYWTISPFNVYNSNANMFYVSVDGSVNYSSAGVNRAIRPVINLRADISFSGGDGTSQNPFVVEGS